MIRYRGVYVSFVSFALLFMLGFSVDALAAPSAGMPYAGNWHVYFDGGNTGTCQIRIAPSGVLNGTCKGDLPVFKVQGKLAGDQVRFGVSSTGARFSGVMVSNVHGVGHWSNGANKGAWYIRKN